MVLQKVKALFWIRLITILFIGILPFYSSFGQTLRSIDGFYNNTVHPEWGSEGDVLVNITSIQFSDGISEPNGETRANPRSISNLMFEQEESIPDGQSLSDYVWVFGQFIDHEIILVENSHDDFISIEIPSDDLIFAQGPPIILSRSEPIAGSGQSEENPRRFGNQVTAYIDGSAIYGSTEARTNWLRTFSDGKLKTSDGNLLPWNTLTGEFNDPRDPTAPFMEDPMRRGTKRFVAGDIRANENPLLIAMHTLFVREHNRLCNQINSEHPEFTDEETFQAARRWIGGILQSITYNEWLPEMGIRLPQYPGYDEETNAQISNVFSAAAFRMGHTLINGNIQRLEADGSEIPGGALTLRDGFFNPTEINLAGGLEPYLRGMAAQVQQNLDCKVVDDVRNFLFGAPGSGGLDLAAINIARGRERGLANYNRIREDLGLPSIKSFQEISNDLSIANQLQEIYGSIDNIDPWVGMLAEDNTPQSMFGSTIQTILDEQFRRLRTGDKFFYLNDPVLTNEEKSIIAQTSLRDIIMRNTDVTIMQENVFRAMDRASIPNGPAIAQVDLTAVAYPNPTYGDFSIKIYVEEESEVSISLFDSNGRRISHTTQVLHIGDNIVPITPTLDAKSSFYNVLVQRGLESVSLRIVGLY